MMLAAITIDQIIHWSGMAWLTLIAVWLVAAPFGKSIIHQQSRWSRFEQIAVLAAGLYLLFGPGAPAWIGVALFNVTVPIALAGLVLVICGLGFSIWARLLLGGNWSGTATLKQGHTLVRRGPYCMVRHPIYTGLLIALLGSALQRGLVRCFLAVLVCAIGFWLKIIVEERLMVKCFGEEYVRYRREVRALAPFFF